MFRGRKIETALNATVVPLSSVLGGVVRTLRFRLSVGFSLRDSHFSTATCKATYIRCLRTS